MQLQPDPPSKSIFKNRSLYSYSLLVIAVLSVAWILFSRWEENRSIERRVRQERTQKELEEDRATLEQLGGKELAIQTFYANSGSIRRGESVQLCYGMANAKTVTLEPQSNPVWLLPLCRRHSNQNHHLHPNHHRHRRPYQDPNPRSPRPLTSRVISLDILIACGNITLG